MYHNHYRSTRRRNYHHLPSSIEEHSVTQGRRREPWQANPQGITETWAQAEGGKGGVDQCGIQRLIRARGAGRIGERRRLTGDGWGGNNERREKKDRIRESQIV